jgi:hypothetical protein
MSSVDQYFDVIYGTNLELNHLTPDPNGINFVGRTSKNNGVVARVKILPGVEANPADTISVAGGGSVMESFLQKEPYYSGRDLFYLKPRILLSDKQLLFYCLCLKNNAYKFNFGRQANKTLRELNIPSVGEIPVWVENTVLPDAPKKDRTIEKNFALNTKSWKWYSYSELFNSPERGDISDTLVVNNNKKGVPVISAATKNNGLIGYLEKQGGKIFSANSITLANTGQGSVGFPAYQEEDFFATNNVSVLSPKFNCNNFVGLFFCALIMRDRYKYSFGRVLNEKRVEQIKLKLPIDGDGKPDWQFMENYIKSLPYSSNL